jgi:hypothetical protein
MGQKMACLGHRGAARSRQDESKEAGELGSKQTDVFGEQRGASRLVEWADFSVVVRSSTCWSCIAHVIGTEHRQASLAGARFAAMRLQSYSVFCGAVDITRAAAGRRSLRRRCASAP